MIESAERDLASRCSTNRSRTKPGACEEEQLRSETLCVVLPKRDTARLQQQRKEEVRNTVYTCTLCLLLSIYKAPEMTYQAYKSLPYQMVLR